MSEAGALLDVLARERVLAVVRAARIADPGGLGRAVAGAGVGALEVTLTTDGALDAIAEIAGVGDVQVGAGTVLTGDDARASVEAGACFLVTPGVLPAVAEVAAESGVPVVMGALTPTEILSAVRLGAVAVKVFPARVGGPAYVRDLRGPFPAVPLVPSGGVDAGNARAFLDAGALAVSSGGGTLPAAPIERGEHEAIRISLARLVAALRGSGA